MKKILFLLSLCLVFAAQAEEGAMDKAGRTAKKSGEVVEQGIQQGAAATNKGVSKAFEAVNDKVFKPADSWIQDKVNKKGSTEKPADK